MSAWRPLDLDPASLPDVEFTAQYCDETRTLMNFWGTLSIEVRPDMTDAERIVLMARLEDVAGDDIA